MIFGSLSLVAQEKEKELSPKEQAKQKKVMAQAQKEYSKAMKLYKKNNLDGALSGFAKAVKKFEAYAPAYYYMADIQYKQNKMGEALKNIQLAKKFHPVMYKINMTRYANTIKSIRESQSSANNNTGTGYADEMSQANRAGRADQYRRMGETRSKMELLKSESTRTLANYHYLNGNIFFKTRKMNEAFPEYEKAVELNPKHGSAYNNICAMLYGIKNFTDAKKFLDQAESNGVEVNPKLKAAIEKEFTE
jgi:tetratricopeptide (TPR) repeat protein